MVTHAMVTPMVTPKSALAAGDCKNSQETGQGMPVIRRLVNAEVNAEIVFLASMVGAGGFELTPLAFVVVVAIL